MTGILQTGQQEGIEMADLIEIKDVGITYQVKDDFIHAIEKISCIAREGEYNGTTKSK